MISRRKFIKSVSGATLLIGSGLYKLHAAEGQVPQTVLGNTGLKTSILAFGTGTSGWQQSSDQTRMGLNKFLKIAQHAYDSGITYFDTADIYGSHSFVAQAIKKLPRDKITLMTKIWPTPLSWLPEGDTFQTLDRFRKELGTDYFDLVLMHNMMFADYPARFQKMRDDLSEAKVKGIVRHVGVSCHAFSALQTAATDPWTEVVLARINHAGKRMDEPPETVMPVLKQAHENGKGVLGMKIYGCGNLTDEKSREESLRYVLGSGNVDAMTIGYEEEAHVDDTVARVKRIVKEIKGNKEIGK
jgi:aryl-alcohol dehydrogenase-like predicted oxidoreductase